MRIISSLMNPLSSLSLKILNLSLPLSLVVANGSKPIPISLFPPILTLALSLLLSNSLSPGSGRLRRRAAMQAARWRRRAAIDKEGEGEISWWNFYFKFLYIFWRNTRTQVYCLFQFSPWIQLNYFLKFLISKSKEPNIVEFSFNLFISEISLEIY